MTWCGKMETKSVFFALFVALSVLCSARADHHCDVSKIMTCLTDVMQSGVLNSFLNPNETMWDKACGTLKTTTQCIREATADCNATEMAAIKSNFAAVESTQKEFCNEAFKCMIRIGDCMNAEPALKTYLSTQITAINTTFCPATRNVRECLHQKVHKKCHVMKQVRDAVHGIAELDDYCREDSCPAMKQCQVSFALGAPKLNGLDDKTCGLFQEYAQCVEGAVASCPGIRPRMGQPMPSQISGMIGQACALMAKPEVIAIYDCPAFTNCIDTFMTTKNAFSAQNLCRTLQGVIGCATKTINSCPAVTSQARTSFIHDANMAALGAADMMCGMAQIYTGSCMELNRCKLGLVVLKADTPFSQQCTAIKTYQGCAGEAVKACNLTRPHSDHEGGMSHSDQRKRPDLVKLSSISQKVCRAMDGQSVSTCKEFQECMGNAEMPTTDAGLVSVDSWCDVSAQTIECVRLLGEQCTVPRALNASVSNIYEELLDEGCPNTFDFQTAEDPTGGTGPLADISTTYLLLLTLVANLIFLV